MQSTLLTLLSLAVATSYAGDPTYGFDTLSLPALKVTYKVGSDLPIAWDPTGSSGNIKLDLIGGPSVDALHVVTTISGLFARFSYT